MKKIISLSVPYSQPVSPSIRSLPDLVALYNSSFDAKQKQEILVLVHQVKSSFFNSTMTGPRVSEFVSLAFLNNDDERNDIFSRLVQKVNDAATLSDHAINALAGFIAAVPDGFLKVRQHNLLQVANVLMTKVDHSKTHWDESTYTELSHVLNALGMVFMTLEQCGASQWDKNALKNRIYDFFLVLRQNDYAPIAYKAEFITQAVVRVKSNESFFVNKMKKAALIGSGVYAIVTGLQESNPIAVGEGVWKVVKGFHFKIPPATWYSQILSLDAPAASTRLESFVQQRQQIDTWKSQKQLSRSLAFGLAEWATVVLVSTNNTEIAEGCLQILTEQYSTSPWKGFKDVREHALRGLILGATSDKPELSTPSFEAIRYLSEMYQEKRTAGAKYLASQVVNVVDSSHLPRPAYTVYQTFRVADVSAFDSIERWKHERSESLDVHHLQSRAQMLEHYGTYRTLFGENRSVSQCYINLAVVHEHEVKGHEKSLRSTGNYEAIHATTSDIALPDLFSLSMPKQAGKSASRVMLLGRAGIGKTTLCQRMAYGWAKQELWPQFEWLFVIPFRSLTAADYPDTKTRLIDVLLRENPSAVESKKAEKMLQLLLDTPSMREKTLVIIDGYDEAEAAAPHMKRLIEESLIQKASLFPHLIVTSRPQADLPILDLRVETIGFTDENIHAYLEHTFSDREERSLVTTYLQSNPMLWGIAHVPIQLEILCQLFKDPELNLASIGTELSTLSKLYTEIENLLFYKLLDKSGMRRALEKRKDELKTVITETLGRLSLDLQRQNRIFFSKSELETHIHIPDRLSKTKTAELDSFTEKMREHLIQSGYLKVVSEGRTESYYFTHLSFQEYFAGKQMAAFLQESDTDGEHDNLLTWLRTNATTPRMALTLRFCAGHLASEDAWGSFHSQLTGLDRNSVGAIYEEFSQKK
jgi:hypothetical protein